MASQDPEPDAWPPPTNYPQKKATRPATVTTNAANTGNTAASSSLPERSTTEASEHQSRQPAAAQASGPTVLTFALKHRPRATRASVPKVRTGCRTCKKRHVKCDEAKPDCSRCLKWQGFCEGYETDASPVAGGSGSNDNNRISKKLPDRTAPAKKQQAATSSSTSPPNTASNIILAKIEPKSEDISESTSSAEDRAVVIKREPSDEVEDIRRSPVLLEPNFNSAMFSYDWEKAYFDRWLILAQDLGGGWFQSNLWTRTIPQLARDDPAVRFAAIAVGAMAQAMSPALLGKSYHHMLAAGSVVPHYRNALTYYGHALRLLRLKGEQERERALGATMGTPVDTDADGRDTSDNLRSAVLSCLMFVCFEALQGNREGALRHIIHGLQIVDQFVARTVPKDLPENLRQQRLLEQFSQQQYQGSRADQEQKPARQREWGENSGLATDHQVSLAKLLTKSPAPYVLEDEVMQVFRRLDFQAWSLGVFRLRRTRPADINFQALDALNPASIPSSFDNLEDARSWWDLVQHWVLQFPRYMVASLQRYMDANPDAAARAQAAGRMLDICDVPHVREIQKDYLHCLESWHAAFWPLYDTTRRQRFSNQSNIANDYNYTTHNESEYLRAISLQIQYLLAWVGVTSLVYSDYEAMYQLTPQLRELNRLAAILLPKQPQRPFLGGSSGELFTMDNGPTMALFIVSCKCRREDVREESIRLLEQYPRRDGFWDSKVLCAIARWNQELEVENEKEGDLYEQWLRLRQREAIFDESKPQVHMTALVKDPATGKYVKVTQTVNWDR